MSSYTAAGEHRVLAAHHPTPACYYVISSVVGWLLASVHLWTPKSSFGEVKIPRGPRAHERQPKAAPDRRPFWVERFAVRYPPARGLAQAGHPRSPPDSDRRR